VKKTRGQQVTGRADGEDEGDNRRESWIEMSVPLGATKHMSSKTRYHAEDTYQFYIQQYNLSCV